MLPLPPASRVADMNVHMEDEDAYVSAIEALGGSLPQEQSQAVKHPHRRFNVDRVFVFDADVYWNQRLWDERRT